MMLSDLAVRRPVFAAVAAIVLCVIGAAAFFFLPVRELPDVDPPIVSVSTSYAGASAEVIESRITEPIEQQIAGIQGVERISSSSRDGRSNVSIEFSLDRNIDDAANDVRDRVSRVAQLQQENAAITARLRQAQGTLDQIASAARLINGGAVLLSARALERLAGGTGPSLERDFLAELPPGWINGWRAEGAGFIDIGTPDSLAQAGGGETTSDILIRRLEEYLRGHTEVLLD